jgi:hypothetical protein
MADLAIQKTDKNYVLKKTWPAIQTFTVLHLQTFVFVTPFFNVLYPEEIWIRGKSVFSFWWLTQFADHPLL